MAFWRRQKFENGWMGAHFLPEGVFLAHVQRVTDQKPRVDLCVWQALDPLRPAEFSGLVRKFRLGRYRGVLVLNPAEYQMLTVESPNVPAEEVKSTVRWRIKDMLHFSVDDAVVDVLEIPGDKNNVSRSRSLLAVAGRGEIIRRHVARMDGAKCPLHAVDVPELAQRNLAHLVEEAGRGLAFLAFAESGGLLTFTCDGELYASRHIDIPLSALQSADSEQRQRYFDRITLELQRSFDHFERQFSHVPLSRLVLAELPEEVNLEAYLSSNLYLPVATVVLEEILDFSRVPGVSPERRRRCLYALGAALRDAPLETEAR